MVAHFWQETHFPVHHIIPESQSLSSLSCQWPIIIVLAWSIFLSVEKYTACIYVKCRKTKDGLRELHDSRKMAEIIQRDKVRDTLRCFICKQKFSVEKIHEVQMLRSGSPGCWLPLPPSCEPVSLPVRHSMSSCTRGEQFRSQLCRERKKKKKTGRAGLAIQRNFSAPAKMVSWKTYGLWYLYGFWHIILIKRRKGNAAKSSNPKHNELAREDAVKSFQ